MNTQFLIEAFGYLGSLLVLVSMLMTSVVKLRIINTIGSVIFTIYAFIIKSYPTAFMNLCLVIINLRFLWKMSRTDKEYEIIKTDGSDALLNHLLDYYHDDIMKCFPGISYDTKKADQIYVVLCQGKPVGMALGKRDGDSLELSLDYSIPEFRDFSIGAYLLSNLKKEGIKKVVYRGPDENHLNYLKRLGFEYNDGIYVKQL
ncbi:MAG: YgjV family protein [Erysipelotrichaceae bacterium]|nr:YgjV family protein [Erysipelotrichaceae bacterium]